MVLVKRLLIGQIIISTILIFTILDYTFGGKIFGEYTVIVLAGILLFYIVLALLYTRVS